jgi:hypothetical protein
VTNSAHKKTQNGVYEPLRVIKWSQPGSNRRLPACKVLKRSVQSVYNISIADSVLRVKHYLH